MAVSHRGRQDTGKCVPRCASGRIELEYRQVTQLTRSCRWPTTRSTRASERPAAGAPNGQMPHSGLLKPRRADNRYYVSPCREPSNQSVIRSIVMMAPGSPGWSRCPCTIAGCTSCVTSTPAASSCVA